MQCFESKMMRLYFFKIISRQNPDLHYDDLVLSDLLVERGIDSIEDLLQLELEELETIASQFGEDLAMAA